MDGVKGLECGDRVIVLCRGVEVVEVREVCVHESENEMVWYVIRVIVGGVLGFEQERRTESSGRV